MLVKRSSSHWSLIHSELAYSPRRPKFRRISLYKVDLERSGEFAEESTVGFANRLCGSPSHGAANSSIWVDVEGYISSLFVEKTISKAIDRHFKKPSHKISFLGFVSPIYSSELNLSLEQITTLTKAS